MQPLRLGFIGAGAMATHTVYPALHLAPIRLLAVCDLDEKKARHVAQKFGSGRWYTDYRRMWEQEELEALIIQMHPGPRQPLVVEALRAGYHVFVPKPPAPSLQQCRELAEAARQAGRVLMVNFQRRFSFALRRARELMASPDFGRMTQLFCSFCSGKYDAARSRSYPGPIQAFLLDFAIHHLDLARYLGGEIDQLSCFFEERDGGAAFAVALQFAEGGVGCLQLNSQRLWWRNYDRLEITGEGSYLVLDGLWSIRHYRESANIFSENFSDERSGELTGDGYAVAEFVDAIRKGREPVCSIEDAVGTMRLYQALLDAFEQDRQGLIPIPS